MLRIWTEQRGQDLVEYALAAGMIVFAGVAAMPALCATVENVFSKVGSMVSTAMQSAV